MVLAALDQAVSTSANTLFALAAAYGAGDPAEYGLFAMIYMAVFFFNGFYLAATIEPISTAEASSKHVLPKVLGSQWILWLAYSGTALFLAVVFGYGQLSFTCALGAALAASGYILRAYYVAIAEPEKALALDVVWFVLLSVGFALLWLADAPSVIMLALIWGCAGCISAIFLLITYDVSLKEVTSRPSWSWRYGREFLMNNAPPLWLIYVLGIFSSAAAVGVVRLVLVLLGPINTLMMAARYAIVPHLSRLSIKDPYATYFLLQIGYCSLAIFCAVVMWFCYPLFESTLEWNTPPALLVFALLAMSKICFASIYASITYLRSVRADGTSRLSAASAILTVCIGTSGAALFDVIGFAIASALSGVVAMIVWINGSLRVINIHADNPVRIID